MDKRKTAIAVAPEPEEPEDNRIVCQKCGNAGGTLIRIGPRRSGGYMHKGARCPVTRKERIDGLAVARSKLILPKRYGR